MSFGSRIFPSVAITSVLLLLAILVTMIFYRPSLTLLSVDAPTAKTSLRAREISSYMAAGDVVSQTPASQPAAEALKPLEIISLHKESLASRILSNAIHTRYLLLTFIILGIVSFFTNKSGLNIQPNLRQPHFPRKKTSILHKVLHSVARVFGVVVFIGTVGYLLNFLFPLKTLVSRFSLFVKELSLQVLISIYDVIFHKSLTLLYKTRKKTFVVFGPKYTGKYQFLETIRDLSDTPQNITINSADTISWTLDVDVKLYNKTTIPIHNVALDEKNLATYLNSTSNEVDLVALFFNSIESLNKSVSMMCEISNKNPKFLPEYVSIFLVKASRFNQTSDSLSDGKIVAAAEQLSMCLSRYIDQDNIITIVEDNTKKVFHQMVEDAESWEIPINEFTIHQHLPPDINNK